MKLLLKRDTFTDHSTIGQLYVDDVFQCDTLEDKVREAKIQNITAIPSGEYEVVLNWSNRFKQIMPELLNVPNYVGVRIHWGNYDKNTDGCILCGNRTTAKDFIGNSRAAYAKLLSKLKTATKKEKIFITIE